MSGAPQAVPPGTVRPVVRRAVFHVGGYERNDAGCFFRRLERELERFQACWSVSATLGAVSSDRPEAASATVVYDDGLRRTETDLTFLDYDDLVAAERARPALRRLRDYAAAFAGYVASGTAAAFFRANWRFGLFFLYPVLGWSVPLLAGCLVWAALRVLPLPGAETAAAVLGVATVLAMLRHLARKLMLFHVKGLWIAAFAVAHGRAPAFERRLDAWADVVAERLARDRFDEILFVGHSFGGALVLDLAARHAARVAAAGGAPAFHVFTVGSTAPMVTMHPRAEAARGTLRVLAGHAGVHWVDVQALIDPINFFRCDPMVLAGVPSPRAEPFPFVYEIRIRDMVDADFYASMKRNVFRIHYQFVSANTRRYGYDYPLVCFGPMPVGHAVVRGVGWRIFDPAAPCLD
jgi:pimeloyl-ACP methyl ester carboxylesterase